MKNLYLLLKTNFITSVGINKILNMKKSRLLLYGIFIIYIIASLMFTFFTYANNIANFLLKYQLIDFMLVLFFVMASFTTFMFSIYSAKSSLFNANDNDMLLSMPIKENVILASRLINIMVWNLITSLFITLPAFIVYSTKVNVPIEYYLFAFIIFLLLPVIPTILAGIIGYIIAYLTSKSNSKNWVELIISFAFVFIFFYITSNGEKILNYLVSNIANIETIIKYFFYPIYLIQKAFNNYDFISLLFYILLNLGLVIIFIYILSYNFKKIISKLQENKTKGNYVVKSLKAGSAIKGLYFKEVRRYFSSPIYVLNTSFGSILLFALALGSIIYSPDQLISMLNVSVGNVSVFQLLLMITAFVAFLSNTTSASISLEGRNFWILKSLPITPQKVFISKILLNLTVVLPLSLLSFLILKFTISLSYYQLFLLIVLSLICTFVSSLFGLLVNLKFPKMDAISDATVVKRSLSSMISLLGPMVIIFTIGGIYSEIGASVSFNVFIGIILLFLILLLVVEIITLNNWGTKRFKEIN